jgi:DNA-binding FrmR family transcriptional regulator
MKAPAHRWSEGQLRRWNVIVGLEDGRKLRNRLRRVEGQVRGLQRMVEEEAPCTDIITQLGSVVAAMEQVGLLIYRHQIEQHIREPLHGGGETQEQLENLVRTVELLLRTDEEARDEQR